MNSTTPLTNGMMFPSENGTIAQHLGNVKEAQVLGLELVENMERTFGSYGPERL